MEEGIGSPTQQIFALPARLLQGKGHGPTSFPFYWANSEYHQGIAGLRSSHLHTLTLKCTWTNTLTEYGNEHNIQNTVL